MPRPRGRRRKQRQAVNPLRRISLPPIPPLTAKLGVLVWGDSGTLPAFAKLQVTHGKLRLPFEATLIWKPGMEVSQPAVMRGFARLLNREDIYQAWEIVAILVDQNLLASSVGSEEERTQTLEVVGDLRLPVYDTRLLWLRRTEATQRVIGRWASEMNEGADEQHSFLRALYKERAMMLTLPPRWHK